MPLKTIFSLIALLAPAAVVIAADGMHTKMVIAVAGADDEMRVEFDSEEAGFDLHDLQVGENRAFVDTSGRNVLVTREAEGFAFDIDGETIRTPAFGPGPAHLMADGDVHVVHGPVAAAPVAHDGVVIISDRAIDAQTQDVIRELLAAAGQTGDVRFIDGPKAHGGPHGIKIVRKTVELGDPAQSQ